MRSIHIRVFALISRTDGECLSVTTIRALCFVLTEMNVSICILIQARSYPLVRTTRKGFALLVLVAARNTSVKHCVSFTWLASVRTGGNAKTERIRDGRKIYLSLLSRLKKPQKSWRGRGLGSGRRQRGKKKGSGRDAMGIGETVEVGERVDLDRGEEVALIGELP